MSISIELLDKVICRHTSTHHVSTPLPRISRSHITLAYVVTILPRMHQLDSKTSPFLAPPPAKPATTPPGGAAAGRKEMSVTRG